MPRILIFLLIATTSLVAQTSTNNPFTSVPTAQLRDELTVHLDEVRGKNFGQKQAIEAKINALAARPVPENKNERVELAQAWKVAADLMRRMKGSTPELAEALKFASELNPDDVELARNAAFEAVRQEKIQARIDEAQRLAEATGNNR